MKAIDQNILKNIGIRTTRQFKAQKRAQLKAIVKAIDEYSIGCCECPGYNQSIQSLNTLMADMKRSHSVSHWGR